MFDFMRDFSEQTGKMLPNEMAKLNSYGKYLNLIPILGPILSSILQAGSSLDAVTTAYGDTGNINATMNAGQRSFGSSFDPGFYGSPNVNRRNWANIAGSTGNYLPNSSNISISNFENFIGGL